MSLTGKTPTLWQLLPPNTGLRGQGWGKAAPRARWSAAWVFPWICTPCCPDSPPTPASPLQVGPAIPGVPRSEDAALSGCARVPGPAPPGGGPLRMALCTAARSHGSPGPGRLSGQGPPLSLTRWGPGGRAWTLRARLQAAHRGWLEKCWVLPSLGPTLHVITLPVASQKRGGGRGRAWPLCPRTGAVLRGEP